MEITLEQLLQLRKERRLTRAELAQQLGCSAGAIVQWEGGKRSIPAWVAEKCTRHYHSILALKIWQKCSNSVSSLVAAWPNFCKTASEPHIINS
jgi:DNA-binding XRE family transcriptional regulator